LSWCGKKQPGNFRVICSSLFQRPENTLGGVRVAHAPKRQIEPEGRTKARPRVFLISNPLVAASSAEKGHTLGGVLPAHAHRALAVVLGDNGLCDEEQLIRDALDGAAGIE
jgi:hypothetical protein